MLVIAVPASGMARTPPEPPYVPGQVLVKFHEDIGRERIADIVQKEGGKIKSVLGRTGIHLVILPEGTDVMEAVGRFAAYPEVRYAEPNFRAEPLKEQ